MTELKTPAQDASQGSRTFITAEELVRKLRQALRREGDFPASAKVVTELKQLTSDPKTTANQVTEVILREPSLGVRVLHLVNSSFYRRAKPIMTVSQAVVQIGMKPLAEMCSSLVLLQKFVPAARRGGSFANCLRKTILTSLLASAIVPGISKSGRTASRTDEYGYLAGSFYELGTLLLAFYFPQLYDTAAKRAELKRQDIGRSIQEITGLSPAQLSLEVIDALELPVFYKDILRACEKAGADTSQAQEAKGIGGLPDILQIGRAVSAARTISEVVSSGKSRQELDQALDDLKNRVGLEPKLLSKIVGELPTVFRNHCACLDLQLPALPEFVMTYSEGSQTAAGGQLEEQENQFNQFVNEIRQAVENREPTASIITSVMETFAWSLGFERVLLLLVASAKTKLVGRLLLGNVPNFDPKKFERPLGPRSTSQAPDFVAFHESRPVFIGEPLFPNGWPVAAIPIGFEQRAIGVIYADCDGSKADTPRELSAREQAAIGILAELLDRSLSLQS